MSSIDHLNRRAFLGAGTAAGLLPAGQLAGRAAANSERDEWPKLRPATIYKLYIGRSGAATNAAGKTVQYLTWGQDEVTKMNNYLGDLEKKLGDVTFVGGETIPPTDVAQVAARAASADGLLLIWLSGHGGDYATLEKLNFGVDKPAVSFFQPFSGHGWMWHQQWKNRKVVLLSTTDWSELDEAVSLLRVPALMKQTRILAVNGPRGTKAACSPEQVRMKLGADLVTHQERADSGNRQVDRSQSRRSRGGEVLDQAGHRNSRTHAPGDYRFGEVLPGGQAVDDQGEGPGNLQRCLHG